MKKKDYNIIIQKTKEIKGFKRSIPLKIKYHKKKLPIYMLKLEENKNNEYIMITGGVHGEEPCGVYSVLESLDIFKKYSKQWNFIIFPCLSPYSYITGSRYVKYSKKHMCREYNLNWQFYSETKNKIAKMIMQKIKYYKPLIVVDVHEDDSCKDLSIFERMRKKSHLIKLKNLKKIIDVFPHHSCYGDPVKNGVILSEDEERTIEYWGFINGSDISITIELPSKLEEYKRIYAGKKCIETILKQVSEFDYGE